MAYDRDSFFFRWTRMQAETDSACSRREQRLLELEEVILLNYITTTKDNLLLTNLFLWCYNWQFRNQDQNKYMEWSKIICILGLLTFQLLPVFIENKIKHGKFT